MTTNTTTETLGLPAKSLAFFTDLANDAGNWSGYPWLSGNVGAGRSASGMAQTLVRHGLIEVGNDDGDAYAAFTPAGIVAAAKLGIDLTWLDNAPAGVVVATNDPAPTNVEVDGVVVATTRRIDAATTDTHKATWRDVNGKKRYMGGFATAADAATYAAARNVG